MADSSNWAFPEELQPRQAELGYDLAGALDAVVGLRAEVPADAYTAGVLGTERAGNGIVIDATGVVLTIGYLVTEAETIWLTTNAGKVVPGHPIGYDQSTGFALVQALGRLDAPALPRGSAADVAVGDPVTVIGHGGGAHSLRAKILSKREFAGYWEYVLDEAIFTAPAHPQWGGSALVDARGRLIGVGSLLVEERVGRKAVQCNMVVPIDLLAPILDDMMTTGRARGAPRAWLGLYAGETKDHIVVGGLAKRGPAERAGLREGDAILEVAGAPVANLAGLFRRVWSLGPAGTEVPLTLQREGATLRVAIKSADRNAFLKKPKLH
ncbi:MAG: serine protease [Alphaproteobacteria bacterium]|nr:serine protease [Alphaproteobacteria bacterium]